MSSRQHACINPARVQQPQRTRPIYVSVAQTAREHPIGIVLTLAAAAPLLYIGNPALGLLVGGAFALTMNKAPVAVPASYSRLTLQTAIVLLGFRLNLETLWSLSATYTWTVALYVLLTLGLGLMLGRWLRADATVAKLIAVGTAICGGTAIATIAPLLRAKPSELGVALAVVFMLNAFALFAFPLIGERLGMSQLEFGLWSALSIHDTSSVVATATVYGDQSADVATSIKLGRTLGLIPLVFGISLMTHSDGAKIRVPGFILLFVAASALGSIVALPIMVLEYVGALSKGLLVVALFLVGAELSRETLRQLQGRTVLHAVLLWVIVAPVTCFAVITFT